VTPYTDFLYFGVLLYVMLPAMLLGLLGWLSWRWTLLATIGMLAVQYSSFSSPWPGLAATRELVTVAAYAMLCYAIALTFLRLHNRAGSRWMFYLAVMLTLLPLVVVKIEPLLQPATPVGFLGISYLTFRALDVIFGIHDRIIGRLPPAQYATFLLFFPTISSGPIDRWRRFESDCKGRRTRTEYLADLDGAVHHIMTGFLYKFIVAALLKTYWLEPLAAGGGRLHLLGYMYIYSLYLFFDFAGYSAFAVGVSYLFGIHTPENFHRPFLARDIRDFWNRWHMSLSYWFRDHVYTRFVYTATKGRWFKSRYRASYLGFFLTFSLMGAWHGLQPYYLLYGVYHASLLVGHDVFDRWNRRHHIWGEGRLWQAAGLVLTFQAVCFGFLLFSGRLGPRW
jgi:membrane protein involved in D-alanine export